MFSRLKRLIPAVAAVLSLGAGAPVAVAQQPVHTYSILSLLDYSGPFANRGKPVEQMQRLLVDWFNETKGRPLGIRLEFKPVDTGYDQAKTVQAYERALQDKSLVGIVTFGSPNVIAIQNRLPNDKVPAVHGGPSYSLMKPGSWVFTPLGDYARYYATAVNWRLSNWKESRPLRVAFVTFDGSSGRDWAQGLQALLKGSKAELVLTEFVPPRALDVSSNVSHITAARPDLVLVATTDQLQPAILKELKANNFDMSKVVNSQHEGLGLLELLGTPKDVYEGTYEVTTQNYTAPTTPAYKIYQERQSRYQTRWSADTLLHFPSVMVLLEAIERAQTKAGRNAIDGAAVFAELQGGKFSGHGLLDNIQFDPKDPTQGADSAIILRQQGGRITAVTNFLPLAK